jgi:hypothetical protein
MGAIDATHVSSVGRVRANPESARRRDGPSLLGSYELFASRRTYSVPEPSMTVQVLPMPLGVPVQDECRRNKHPGGGACLSCTC